MTWKYLVSEPLLLVCVILVAMCVLAFIGLIVWVIWDKFRPRMTKGVVCDKKFIPEHDHLSFTPMPVSTGQGMSTILLPQYTSCDDEWVVVIKGRFRGKIRKEKYSVTKEFYDRVQIGSFVDFDEED